jgi:hypothetical protein
MTQMTKLAMPPVALGKRYVTRIIVRPDSIDIELREPTLATEPLPAIEGSIAADVPASSTCTTGHQPALEHARVPFDQGSPASARGQADAQTGDQGRYSPIRSSNCGSGKSGALWEMWNL